MSAPFSVEPLKENFSTRGSKCPNANFDSLNQGDLGEVLYMLDNRAGRIIVPDENFAIPLLNLLSSF